MNKKNYRAKFVVGFYLLLLLNTNGKQSFAKNKHYFFTKNDEMCTIALSSHLEQTIKKKSQELLSQYKYQEAIWFLTENNEKDDANRIRSFLTQLLTKGDLLNYRRPIKKLGGATSPSLYQLPCNVKAVFKPKISHPSSNYRSEVGAYLIDLHLAFNLVPLTVFRTIKKEKGSFQYFVQDTTEVLPDTSYLKSTKLHIFDYIIRNKDRNAGNLLLLGKREVAIDHGLCLRRTNFPGRMLTIYDGMLKTLAIKSDKIRAQTLSPKNSPQLFQGEKSLIAKLKATSYEDLESFLKETLKKKNIKMLYNKIKRLNKYLDNSKNLEAKNRRS